MKRRKNAGRFITALLLIMIFVGGCAGMLVTQYRSHRYIGAEQPAMLSVSIKDGIACEVELMGEHWSFPLPELPISEQMLARGRAFLPKQLLALGAIASAAWETLEQYEPLQQIFMILCRT